MKTPAIIIAAAFLSGCAGLGRVAQFGAGIVAPEYKATVDNLYSLLLDDQLVASLDVEVVLQTADGQIFRKADLSPVVLTSSRTYDWESLPRGAWQRFLGTAPDTSAADEQKRLLAEALKAVPATDKKE